MIKKLDLIYEGDFVYAIKDSNVMNPSEPTPNKYHVCLGEIIHNAYPENAGNSVPTIVFHGDRVGNCSSCREILASSDPSLNLPLLPIDANWEGAYKRAFPNAHLVGEHPMRDMKDGFMEGYKVGSEKKWTSGQIFEFIKYIRNYEDFYDLMDSDDGANMETLIDQYLLTNPVSVIVNVTPQYSETDPNAYTIRTKGLKKEVQVIKWVY